jgi:hypothetical protein
MVPVVHLITLLFLDMYILVIYAELRVLSVLLYITILLLWGI